MKKERTAPFESNYEYLKAMTESLSILRSSESKVKADTKLKQINRRIAITLNKGKIDLPLERIAEIFELDRFEVFTLIAALVPSISGQFEDIDDIFPRSINTHGVLHFLCDSFSEIVEARKYFLHGGNLIKHGLISSHARDFQSESDFMNADIEVPRRISNMIFGVDDMDDELRDYVSISDAETKISDVILPKSLKRTALNAVNVDSALPSPIVIFAGESGTGKTTLARAIANSLGYRFMEIETPMILKNRYSSMEEHIRKIFTEAYLQNALLYFHNFDELLENRDDDLVIRRIFKEAKRTPYPVILSGGKKTIYCNDMDKPVNGHIAFPVPDPEARLEIWSRLLPPNDSLLEESEIHEVAEQYELTAGGIKKAINNARNFRDNNPDRPMTGVIRKSLEINLKHQVLARNIRNGTLRSHRRSGPFGGSKKDDDEHLTEDITPSVSLDDVILPPSLMEDVRSIIAAAETQDTVFNKWGFGEKIRMGQSVTSVFYGKSGTGKTYTAEAIAFALGRKLKTIRASALTNKYVGETEKNIAAVFKDADSDCVLFFDEADSFFHDRPEGSDYQVIFLSRVTNLLLREIELFKGVIILATNRPLALDPAFERRIRYKLEFPLPAAEARKKIWMKNFPDKAPMDDDVDFDFLAERFEFSGGQIRNSVVRAACLAAEREECITQDILLEAADKEKTFREKSVDIGFCV